MHRKRFTANLSVLSKEYCLSNVHHEKLSTNKRKEKYVHEASETKYIKTTTKKTMMNLKRISLQQF